MQRFVLLALFGLAAQLVDGSLGMAYGVTSTTLLVLGGVAPAAASASVHLSEIGTTLVSGLSHWRFGNTDWRSVRWIALPGGAGAFFGALALTSISAATATTWIALFLLCMGVYVLGRFTLGWRSAPISARHIKGRFLAPLGLVGGFLDAAGGGGWGPIVTPTLLASGRMEPRKVIGTVDTSEFLVSVGASVGFLIGLQRSAIAVQVVGALLLGGVLAAPLAAWLARKMHPQLLGAAVGGMIVFTNSHTLMKAFHANADVRQLAYASVITVWLAAIVLAVQSIRGSRELSQQAAMGD
jgi:uncharacterized membrane protein YfcA